MDHNKALQTGAALRYALNEMSDEERADYEEHFFTCPVCAEEVKAAVELQECLLQELEHERPHNRKPVPVPVHSPKQKQSRSFSELTAWLRRLLQILRRRK